MSFGFKSAGATFQRMIDCILSGLIGTRCLVYLDDVIVFGELLWEHNLRLREIFQRLREYNVQSQPDKCEFLKTKLKYLG
mgnify:CR=1 FL=1